MCHCNKSSADGELEKGEGQGGGAVWVGGGPSLSLEWWVLVDPSWSQVKSSHVEYIVLRKFALHTHYASAYFERAVTVS